MRKIVVGTAAMLFSLSLSGCVHHTPNESAPVVHTSPPMAPRELGAATPLTISTKSLTKALIQKTVAQAAKDVSKIEYSSDGKRILTLSPQWDYTDIDIPKYVRGRVQLWNRDGKLLRTLDTKTEILKDTVFLRDNKTVVTVHPRRMRFWNVESGRLQRIIPTQSGLVAFTPDRSLAATARASDIPTKVVGVNKGLVQLQIFDMSKGTLRSQSRVMVPPDDAGFSGDMPLGFLERDRQIRALPLGNSSWMNWETNNAKYLSLKTNELWDKAVPQVVSHDGTIALSLDHQNVGPHFQPRALTLRESMTWKPIMQIVVADTVEDYKDVAAAVFSPDDKLLSAIVNGSLWFFDTSDWHVIKKQKLANTDAVLAFSPDGRTFVTGGEDKITQWRTQ